MSTLHSFACALSFLSLLGSAVAAGPTLRSGPARVTLVELYTSEGCSSCPPAEKWLGELRTAPGLWTEFVPIAFHVNYWDHLGWRDALASKVFTEREHAYAAAWRSSSVYTPCFVRNGEEWRPRDGTLATRTGAAADAGVLTVTWIRERNVARVDYAAPKSTKAALAFNVNAALLGNGIVTNVRKGENSGRDLRHEFVALRFETATMKRDDAGTWSAEIALPPRPEIKSARGAIAAWVTTPGQLTPLQATGGWLE